MANNEYTVKDAALEMIPIYGTYKSAERFVNNPSWSGAVETELSLVGDIGTLFGVGAAIKGLSFANKARKAYKAANAASKAAGIARQKYWAVASTAGKQLQHNKSVINSLSLDDRGLPKKAWQIIRQRIADNKNLENALSTARQVDKNSLDAAKTAYTNASNLSSRTKDFIQSSAASTLFGVGVQGIEAGVSKHDDGGPFKPIVGKVSGVQRSSINNNQDYFEQHFTTELDGGTNYSGVMGNNEYFVRKTPDGKYMYNIQGEDGTIFQGENESSLPVDARKFLDNLYNIGTQRFPTKRHDNGGQIKPNFIKRLEDPNRKSILDWASKPTWRNNYTYDISTHKMGYEYTPDDSGRAIVYPEVQEINGKLVDFTRPPYHNWAGYDSALDRGDYLIMKDLEDARKWVESYKDRYENLK